MDEEKLVWQAICERKSRERERERERGEGNGEILTRFSSLILKMKHSQNDAKQAISCCFQKSLLIDTFSWNDI